MQLTINIPDERLSEFARLYETFLKGQEEQQAMPGEELWGVKDIASYLGKTASNLYGSQRYLIPPESLAIAGGRKNKRWRKEDVIEHLRKCGRE